MHKLLQSRDWRDIWSSGGGVRSTELLASCMATLLMQRPSRPTYFASPFITDFVLFDNRFRGFAALFPEFADHAEIRFSQFLAQLSATCDVRLMTTAMKQSAEFLENQFITNSGVQVKLTPEVSHEKGILAQTFYLEGSMNLTHKGVYINGEKITYYVPATASGADKIARAYLEFDRRWQNLH